MSPKDGPDSDGLLSYEIGHAALREACVRGRDVSPSPGDTREARWAEEGWTKGNARKRPDGKPDWSTLETVRSGE